MENVVVENNKPVQRQSNFELLRVLGCFFIIVYHIWTHANANLLISDDKILFLGDLLCNLGRISVNLFVVIGSWFMVDKACKIEKSLMIYSQLLFYTLIAFIVGVILVHQYSWNLLFPFSTFALWFVSAYICLLLVVPFLNKLLNLNKSILDKLLVLLTIFFPVVSTFGYYSDRMIDTVFFFYLYLIVGYYKKYLNSNITISRSFVLICSMFLYFLLIKFNFVSYTVDIKAFPNVIISLGIFYFFANLKLKYNKCINFLAKSVLATYIIHEMPNFYNYLWLNIYKVPMLLNSKHSILCVVFIAITLMLACAIIDYFRRLLFEKVWYKSKFYNFLKSKLDNFYKDVI